MQHRSIFQVSIEFQKETVKTNRTLWGKKWEMFLHLKKHLKSFFLEDTQTFSNSLTIYQGMFSTTQGGRGSEQASPKCATWACELFWTKDN